MPYFANVASATFVAILITALSPSSKAWAATLFMGDSNGTFGSPTIDSSVDSAATFSIEKPNSETESFVSGEPGDGSMPNKLTFVRRSFSALPNQAFSIGSLSYLNGQTFSGTNVSSVPISISLNLLEPAQTQQFEYSFMFNLTPNADTHSSADSLTISDNPTPQAFTLAQETYQLKVLGFSADNGVTFTRQFQVPEDQAINSVLFAQIEKEDSMPEPPTKPTEPESPIQQPTEPTEPPVQPTEPTEVPEPVLLSGLLAGGSVILLKKRRSNLAQASQH
ncbi:MAG: choice-of-anchor K domain-containing protein [Phormidesmis sp.]